MTLQIGRWPSVLVFAAALIAGASRLQAWQDAPSTGLSRAKALYTAASYEEALAATADLTSPEALEYRALCLLALGRGDEAQQAIDALVKSSPMFVVSPDEAPPRFVGLVRESRVRLLPDLMREVFAGARDRFQAKSYDQAAAAFDEVLTLAADPVLAGAEGTADLRLLASSYIELAKAAARATAIEAVTPTVPIAPAGDTRGRPASATGASPGRIPPGESEITEAKPIRQAIPTWPTAAGPIGRDRVGAIRITVGTDGRVAAAVIQTSVHPVFDRELIAATGSWLYTPATFRGHAIEMDKVIEIRIDAR